MLAVSILMFVLATMQLGINFTRIIRGFVVNEGHTEAYYNVLDEFTQIFGSAMYIVQTFVGDGVAIYRCYIVWSRRWAFILFPCTLYIGSLVTGIGILVAMGQATDGSLVFVNRLGRWISSFFAFTLVTSTTCTLMIASRIWYLSGISARAGIRGSNLHPVARVIVESGAIYSSMLVTLLILYGQKSWFQYIIVDAVSFLLTLSSLIGIVFSIIIVRIGLGIAMDPDTVQGTMASTTINGSSRDGGRPVHELSAFEASGNPDITSASYRASKVNTEGSVTSGHSGDATLKHEKSVGSSLQV
ncbi:hypothetical protein J132_05791 [Termitomyces sp. J132]|nr:hypothetical protein J132_05791 [Termitomyces sp. J132]